MARPNPYAEINNRDSAIVQEALQRKCIMCKARPGEDCRSLIYGQTVLPGRAVHYSRTVE